jgi:phenylacetic acid degradation operon negative regulatory protein
VPAQPRHLILELLVSVEGGVLSARAAIDACALFGIRENSVRVALARLAAAGLIEGAGRGAYRIGPNGATLADEVRAWRTVESRVRPWRGEYVAVLVSPLARSDRPALRLRDRALALVGFRELERDLFVRPDNLVGGVAGVRARLHQLGLEPAAAVFLAGDLDPDRDARARSLWDGAKLTRSYQKTREKLERWLARAPGLAPETAARQSFLLGSAAIRHLVFDPLLPEPMVDVRARRALVDAAVAYDRAGHAIWRALLTSQREAA